MPSVVPRRLDVTSNADAPLERLRTTDVATSGLVRLCAAGFVAYCSYAICRTPLLPLFARDLGAGPSMIGFVMGASTLTGIFLKLPAGAWSDILGRRPLLVLGALVFATLPFTYLGVSTLAVTACSARFTTSAMRLAPSLPVFSSPPWGTSACFRLWPSWR